MRIEFSNYFDTIGGGSFSDFSELIVTRVSQEIEAALMTYTHPSSAQVRHDKYGEKIRELVSGLGETLCSSILSVIFENEEIGDSLQVRFKGRRDIRLNIYFDPPEKLLFDNEVGSHNSMTIMNEDEAYLSYISSKQRFVEFGTLETVIKELKAVLADGLSSSPYTQVVL